MEFTHFTSEQGLSQNTAFCMLQDRDGFVWVGTRDGLNRFNGYDFTVFQTNKEDSSSISNNRILCLSEDNKGKIWVGTTDGLNIYDKDREQFTRIKNINLPSSNNNIFALTLDSHNRMWIGTDGGDISIYHFSSNTYRLLSDIIQSEVDIKHLQVRTIIEIATGEIWIGTLNQGLFIYNEKKNTFENFTFEENNPYGLLSNAIRTLYADKKGNVWIGSDKDGCTRYNLHLKTFSHFTETSNLAISNNVVRTIQEGPTGEIWIGTLSGMSCYTPKTNTIKTYTSQKSDDRSLSNQSVRCFLFDQLDNFWVGTYYGGINIHYSNRQNIHFAKSPFSNFETNNYGIVSSFAEEGNGNLWIGTENRGLYFYDANQNTIQEYQSKHIKDEVIKSLYFEKPSSLWIGTYGGGLCILNTKTDQCVNYQTNDNNTSSITSNNIYTILKDSKERIWIGTSSGGLNQFDPIKKTFSAISPKDKEGNFLIGNTINDLKEGPDGSIWIASENSSLIRYDGYAFSNISESIINPCEANFNSIRCILFDSWGNLWAGNEMGLFGLDVKEGLIAHYDRSTGLAGNLIYGILEDTCNNLWISGINGITKFPLSKHYPLPQKKDTLISIFTSKNGLQGNEFNRGACKTLPNHLLMFGGINGFNCFHPLIENIEQKKLKITFEALYVLNTKVIPSPEGSILKKHIRNTSSITLSNSQSSFSFEYITLDFNNSEHTQYTYKLEGFDDDWINAGTSRKAIYTKVPPGNYIFMVKAGNTTGVWNSNMASLKIKISPPYWKSWWAISLYLLVLTIVVYSYIRWLNYTRKQQELLKKERDERFKIKEMDDMKSEFFANVSHQFRTPLTLIAGPIEKLRNAQIEDESEKTHLISLMDRNVTRLQQLISQLMDFSRVENKMMKIQVSKDTIDTFINEIIVRFEELFKQKELQVIFISKEKKEIFFDKRVIENIISIILSNATKYTPRGEKIDISVENTPLATSIKIANTGSTIPAEKIDKIFNRFYSDGEHSILSEGGGTGIGLSFAKNLIRLHHGEILVQSQDELTTFTITFPSNKEDYRDDEIYSDTASNLVKDKITNTNNATIEDEDKCILIVEDEIELRAFIKSLFSNYKVYEAENGKEGFKLAKKYIPDLIISDVMMPIMDGIEFCGRIKNHLSTNHIPLILLTAKTAVEHRIDGTNSGADLYMDKPFVVSVLQANVANLIAQRKRLEARFSSSVNEDEETHLYKGESKLIQQAENIIKMRIGDPNLNVEDLAKDLLLSRSQLFRKFKTVSPYSPNEFIKVTRLKYALELLLKDELNVTEISYDSGFSSPSLFITTFKKHYGKTPKEYLKNLKS